MSRVVPSLVEEVKESDGEDEHDEEDEERNRNPQNLPNALLPRVKSDFAAHFEPADQIRIFRNRAFSCICDDLVERGPRNLLRF